MADIIPALDSKYTSCQHELVRRRFKWPVNCLFCRKAMLGQTSKTLYCKKCDLCIHARCWTKLGSFGKQAKANELTQGRSLERTVSETSSEDMSEDGAPLLVRIKSLADLNPSENLINMEDVESIPVKERLETGMEITKRDLKNLKKVVAHSFATESVFSEEALTLALEFVRLAFLVYAPFGKKSSMTDLYTFIEQKNWNLEDIFLASGRRRGKSEADEQGKGYTPFGVFLFRPSELELEAEAIASGTSTKSVTDLEKEDLGLQREICISFRGTQSIADWFVDADFIKKRPGDGIDGKVHRGFLRLYKSCEDYIYGKIEALTCFDKMYSEYSDELKGFLQKKIGNDSQMKENTKMYVCGHSLGGALATLMASTLFVKGYSALTYTIGCPRVGNRKFANWFNKNIAAANRSWRFKNARDPFTHLPPAAMNYRHVKNLIRLEHKSMMFKVHMATKPVTIPFRKLKKTEGKSDKFLDSLEMALFHHPEIYGDNFSRFTESFKKIGGVAVENLGNDESEDEDEYEEEEELNEGEVRREIALN